MDTPVSKLDSVSQAGQAIFERDIAHTLGDANPYDYVAIEIKTGDYEVGPSESQTVRALRARHAEPEVWVRRVATIYARKIRRSWKAVA